MGGATVTIERAGAAALSYVETLLDDHGLPSADVRSKPACFYIGTDDGTRVGIGGLETRETDGLLRSLVVEPTERGRGYGTAICEEIETVARDDGVQTLYLLTTTAAEFFETRGYAEIDREAVESCQ